MTRGPETTPFEARWYVGRDLEGFLWGFSTYEPRKKGRAQWADRRPMRSCICFSFSMLAGLAEAIRRVSD